VPRFVILEHDHPVLHWDLMLQHGAVLRSWRLLRSPETPGEAIDAIAIGDHRPMYLDYEGPVSGDRGTVKRWDAGDYEADEDDAASLRLDIRGRRLIGAARLERIDGERWVFMWEPGC
jgi:hypothetical protein